MNTPWTDAEIAQLEGSFRDAPGSRVFAALADAYRDRGRVDDALALLKRGNAQHPDYVSALVLQAQCELQLGHVEDAEVTYARVTELDPENLMALKYRAERSARHGGIEQARAWLQQVLEIDPFDAQARAAQQRLASTGSAATAPAPDASSDAARFDSLGAVQAPPPPTPSEADGVPYDPGSDFDMESGLEESAFETPSSPDVEPASDAETFDVLGLGARPTSQEVQPPPDAAATDADVVSPVQPESPPVAPSSDSHGTPLADWHVQRADDRIVVRQGPDPGPGESELAPPARPTDEFSTLTLARIYESQGYLDKALAIYQKLHERHPDHPEVVERLRAVQERMAGFEAASEAQQSPELHSGSGFASADDASSPAWETSDAAALDAAPHAEPPASETGREPDNETEGEGAEQVPSRSGSAWRLLDVGALDSQPQHAADELRDLTENVRAREMSKRHTVIGNAASTPERVPATSSPGAGADAEPDFERFLRYVRSIKR